MKIWSKLLRCLRRRRLLPAAGASGVERPLADGDRGGHVLHEVGRRPVLGGEVALRLVGEPLEDVRPVSPR